VRILIVKTSSMGDVIHALPVAADLSTALPQVQIDWLVEESFAAIPAMNPHVARVRPVALRRWRRTLLVRSTWHELSVAQQAVEAAGYDWVLDVQGLVKSAWMARWAAAPVAGPASSSARERWASLWYTRPVNVPRELHAVERCRRIGAAVFGYDIDTPPRFDLSPPVSARSDASAPYAVLLVNASRATKLWPEERWLALERWLATRGITSLLFWGAADEAERAERLAQAMQQARVMPRARLDSIAATMNRAAIVIGLDTGLTHLAAALGRPTIGIFCDYDPSLVGLVGPGPVTSLGGVANAPTAEAVIAAAEAVLQGSP
jgi:heptosyltransferase-1